MINNNVGIDDLLSLHEYEQRVIQLENELIELIEHCAALEAPGVVIDSAMQTLMKNKTIDRMPDPGAYNA